MTDTLPALLPSIPCAIEAIDKLKIDIRNAPSLETLKAMKDAASFYQKRFKKVKEVSDVAGEAQIAADVKLADELNKLPKAKGTRGQIQGRKKGSGGRGNKANLSSGGTITAPPDEKWPTLAEMGIDKKWAAQAHKVSEISEDLRAQFIEQLKADGKDVTPKSLLAKNRSAKKEEKKQIILKSRFSADGPFGTVVTDPPWEMEKIDRDVRPNQDGFDYNVMSEEEIVAQWKSDIEPKLEADCHLFMWTTQKFLPVSLRIIETIGFRYVFTVVWHKPGGFQPIGLPQYNCEFAVYARRGSPLFVDVKDFFCCFSAPRREHSRKPDEFYDLVRRVTGGSRIDVYSREPREGFAQFGNETDKFSEVA
jgi:N6-adenosine-specific RNA methylase IME4